MCILTQENEYLTKAYGELLTAKERNEIIIDNIKKLREMNNFKSSDVAEAIGVSIQSYSNYENGKNMPVFETIVRLADLYRVSVDFIVGYVPAPYNMETAKYFDEQNIEQMLDKLEELQHIQSQYENQLEQLKRLAKKKADE